MWVISEEEIAASSIQATRDHRHFFAFVGVVPRYSDQYRQPIFLQFSDRKAQKKRSMRCCANLGVENGKVALAMSVRPYRQKSCGGEWPWIPPLVCGVFALRCAGRGPACFGTVLNLGGRRSVIPSSQTELEWPVASWFGKDMISEGGTADDYRDSFEEKI